LRFCGYRWLFLLRQSDPHVDSPEAEPPKQLHLGFLPLETFRIQSGCKEEQ
jgi:hypothetical protein